MVDRVPVELVTLEPVFAAGDGKRVARHRGQQQSLVAANRAIALDRLVRNVAFDRQGHRAAMAGRVIAHGRPFLVWRHRLTRAR